MRKLFTLLALFLFYLLFSAKSCSQGEEFDAIREQKKLKTTKDSIVKATESKELSTEVMRSYENTAMSWFNDFSVYYSLLADTTKAIEFRSQAGNMIKNLFNYENTNFQFTGIDGTGVKKLNLDELIKQAVNGKNAFSQLKPDSIWIINGLQKVHDSLYEGRLGFSGTLYFAGEPHSIKNSSAKFFLLKRNKNFGKETINAWSLALGQTKISLSFNRAKK